MEEIKEIDFSFFYWLYLILVKKEERREAERKFLEFLDIPDIFQDLALVSEEQASYCFVSPPHNPEFSLEYSRKDGKLILTIRCPHPFLEKFKNILKNLIIELNSKGEVTRVDYLLKRLKFGSEEIKVIF